MKRLIPLDALRGLIMMVMALDHANLLIARAHSRPEMWGGFFPIYTDPLVWMTRVITHLAAPGFFWLMGASMILFATGREKLGWTRGAVIRFLVLRGTLLILLQLLVENPAWIWGTGGPLTFLDTPIYLGVLYGLGGAMILGALFLWAEPSVLLAISAALWVGTEIAIRYFAPDALRFSPVMAWLLLPDGAPQFDVLYPILPWLGVTTFGMAFGKWFVENPELAYRRALSYGIVFLAVFVPLRALNGFGNIRPQLGTGWMAFLNPVKYPPAVTFLLPTLGIDFALLFAFSRRAAHFVTRSTSPLLIFGATPLFFYLAHLYLYGFIGRTFFPTGTGIAGMYPWWLIGLVILYPLCRVYSRFQNTRPPNSVWRFF